MHLFENFPTRFILVVSSVLRYYLKISVRLFWVLFLWKCICFDWSQSFYLFYMWTRVYTAALLDFFFVYTWYQSIDQSFSGSFCFVWCPITLLIIYIFFLSNEIVLKLALMKSCTNIKDFDLEFILKVIGFQRNLNGFLNFKLARYEFGKFQLGANW